jgi:hypothetical protein
VKPAIAGISRGYENRSAGKLIIAESPKGLLQMAKIVSRAIESQLYISYSVSPRSLGIVPTTANFTTIYPYPALRDRVLSGEERGGEVAALSFGKINLSTSLKTQGVKHY